MNIHWAQFMSIMLQIEPTLLIMETTTYLNQYFMEIYHLGQIN